ncbi:MAG: AtpZ/AtpI family protein [Bacteroidota bacterium]|jgi:F0F1-type ATP synthase assembly protein I|nr:AtpZ/AtpI family protein [Bacteroidota bacterium]
MDKSSDSNNKELKKNDGKNPLNDYMKYSGVAFQMVAVIGICVWGGIELDKKFQTNPLFIVVLTLIGIFGSIYTLYRSLPKE